jgi:hypothetical protein
LTDALRAPAAGLELVLDVRIDARVRQLCEREFEGMAATLSDWGRFRRPVHLVTVRDRAELVAASPCPTEGLLRAMAGLDRLMVLAPDCWGSTPSPMELERTLVHELAHVLMFQRCAPPESTREVRLPTWFREGMATVVAEGTPSPGGRRPLADHPALDDLLDADASVIDRYPTAAYGVACQAFQNWLERFGSRRLSALCRAMRGGHGFEAAHLRACAVSVDDWTRQWVADVRREAART